MKILKARPKDTSPCLKGISISKEAKHLHSSSELSLSPFQKQVVDAFRSFPCLPRTLFPAVSLGLPIPSKNIPPPSMPEGKVWILQPYSHSLLPGRGLQVSHQIHLVAPVWLTSPVSHCLCWLKKNTARCQQLSGHVSWTRGKQKGSSELPLRQGESFAPDDLQKSPPTLTILWKLL